MLLSDQAKAAYGAARPTARVPRSTEYELFAQITARLNSAKDKPFAELVEAVTDNRRLWSRLSVFVADQNNALPEDLRAQIFYLGEFTEVQSRRILAGQATIDALVDVNRSIMRGLLGQQIEVS